VNGLALAQEGDVRAAAADLHEEGVPILQGRMLGQPVHSGTYPLGSIRMRQSLAGWQGSHEQGMRLLVRHIHNVVDDIRREMPLREARHVIALGGDVRFAAGEIVGDLPADGLPVFDRDAFVRFVDSVVGYDMEQLVEKYRLPQSEAETLVPALLAYRELLVETSADRVTVPDASLRDGLLLDLVRSDQPQGLEDLRKQVLSIATTPPTPATWPTCPSASSTSCAAITA
jgi:exopolyphosphatase/guanosine-5'-triphosphate,3'-diphosphate pyrophosphatase